MSNADLANKLANEPVELTTKDGQVLTLHYGYGGLRKIEDHFEGVRPLLDALAKPLGPGFFDAVFCGLLYGLWKQGITEEQLEDMIEPDELMEHAKAVSEAIVQAFPRLAQAKAENAPQEKASTGKGPGTSPSSSAELARSDSGT